MDRFVDTPLRHLNSRVAFFAVATCLVLYNALGVLLASETGESDYWEHLAAIGAFADSPFQPSHPFLRSDVPSHLLTPYHFAIGLIARVFAVEPIYLLPFVAALNTALFLFACRRFARTFLPSVRLALQLVLILLFFWIRPWPWSGFYHFALLPGSSVYPFWFAFSIALLALSAFRWESTFLKRSANAVLAALLFVIHPLSGAFLVVGVLCLALVSTSPTRPALAIRSALFLLIFLGGLLAWPYFPVLQAVLGSARFAETGLGGQWAQFYDKAYLRIFPSLCGLAFLLCLWKRPRYRFHIALAATMLAVYVVNGIAVHSSMLSRFVIYVAFAGHVGLALGVGLLGRARLRLPIHGAFAMGLLGLAALQVREAIAQFRGDGSGGLPSVLARSNIRTFGHLSRLRRWIPAGSVVLANRDLSWRLPSAIRCKVIAPLHPDPFMLDFRERNRDLNVFLQAGPSDEERRQILLKYGVRYVVLSPADKVAKVQHSNLVDIPNLEGGLRLFKVQIPRSP